MWFNLRRHPPQPYAKLVNLMLLLTTATGLKSISKACTAGQWYGAASLMNDVKNYITSNWP